MEFLDTQELVGKAVPNPYIDKVTLQASGDNPPKVVNPHIVDPNEISSKPSPVATNEILKTTVNISIKDMIRDQKSNLFKKFPKAVDNLNIEQLFRIYVVEFRSQTEVADFIPDSSYLVQNFNASNYRSNSISDIEGDINNPNTYVEVTNDNKRIYSIPYVVEFESRDRNPGFLSYGCWVEVDIEKLQKQFDFEGYFPESCGDLLKSNFQYINVIKGDELVRRASYFTDSDGRIWPGPVHQMPNGQWMTGANHSNGGVPLTKIETVNSRVQDLRVVDDLEKINLDFTIVQNSLKADPMFSSKARTANINLDKETKAFSSMFLTRDRQNNVRYMFAANIGRILQLNSEFPQLLNNDFTRDGIVSGSTINNIQLRRIRLAGSPEAGAEPRYTSDDIVRSPIKFDHGTSTFNLSGTTNTTDQDEVVFNISPSDNRLTSDTVNQFGSIYTRESSADEQSIFYYSGIDRGASLKTDGFYQYKVIMSIKDGSVEYLESQMRSLIDTKKDIEGYLEEASKLGTPGFRNPFSDPHIDPPWEIEGYAGGRSTLEPRAEKPGNFNPSANRFTQNFINQQLAKEENQADYIWNVASNLYGNIYANLSGQSQSSLEVENIKDALENYMNPNTGNPNGINFVIKLYDQMIDKLKQQIGIVRDPRVSKFTANQTGATSIQTQGGARDKIVKVEFTFPEIYSSNNLTTEGTDVLGMPDITGSSMRVISGEQFTNLITAETQKIFVTSSSQLSLSEFQFIGWDRRDEYLLNSLNITDYSYLTPTILLSKGKEVNTTSSNNPIDYEEIMNGAQAGRSNSLLSFLSSEHNISLVSENEPTLPFRQPFKGPVLGEASVNVEENYRKRANESSLNAGLVDASLSELARNLNPLNSSDIIASASSIDMYNPDNVNGLVDDLTVQQVGQLPNQIKALMSYGLNGPNNPAGQQSINDNALRLLNINAPTEFQYQPEYKYKFQTIYRIEAFNGWQNESTTTGSSAPVNTTAMADSWITMDRDVYNAARTQEKTLFCRIRRYENQPLGIYKEPTKEPPLFEEYFFINPQGNELPAPFFITPEELIRISGTRPNGYPTTDVTVATSPAEATIRARAQVQQNQSSQGPQPGQSGGAFTRQNAEQRRSNALRDVGVQSGQTQAQRATVTYTRAGNND